MQNILNRLRLSFSRYRHGKGFGIHSPFAYRFITEVLRQPYAYYSYDELKGRQSRLVVRLAAYFKPRRIRISCRALEDDVRKALPYAVFADENPDFVITDAAGLEDAAMLRDISVGQVHVMVVGPGASDATQKLLPLLGNGMSFSNGHDCVVIASFPHLPRQDFQVRF